MNITEIKTKAKDLGIQVGKLRKGDLIRAIQSKEGNFPCFESAKEYCSQKACCWRDACLPSKKSLKEWEKKKKTYTKKVESELKDLKKQLANLKTKAQKLVGKGKEDALDELNKIEKMMTTLSQKTHKFAATSEDAWKTARKGIDEAWSDITTAFKKAAGKFR